MTTDMPGNDLDFSKASPAELAKEVVKLRLYVASLSCRMADFMEHKELSDEAASTLGSLEHRQQQADCLIEKLEEKFRNVEQKHMLLTSQIENLERKNSFLTHHVEILRGEEKDVQ